MNSLDDHYLDEDGEHDEDQCQPCLEARDTPLSSCRCGICCRRLLIEATLYDAKREPRIAEKGSPIFTDERLTESGQAELASYFLNSEEDMACVFLNRTTNQCNIYETRPGACRVFDCDGEGREQLIELGILDRLGKPLGGDS